MEQIKSNGSPKETENRSPLKEIKLDRNILADKDPKTPSKSDKSVNLFDANSSVIDASVLIPHQPADDSILENVQESENYKPRQSVIVGFDPICQTSTTDKSDSLAISNIDQFFDEFAGESTTVESEKTETLAKCEQTAQIFEPAQHHFELSRDSLESSRESLQLSQDSLDLFQLAFEQDQSFESSQLEPSNTIEVTSKVEAISTVQTSQTIEKIQKFEPTEDSEIVRTSDESKPTSEFTPITKTTVEDTDKSSLDAVEIKSIKLSINVSNALAQTFEEITTSSVNVFEPAVTSEVAQTKEVPRIEETPVASPDSIATDASSPNGTVIYFPEEESTDVLSPCSKQFDTESDRNNESINSLDSLIDRVNNLQLSDTIVLVQSSPPTEDYTEIKKDLISTGSSSSDVLPSPSADYKSVLSDSSDGFQTFISSVASPKPNEEGGTTSSSSGDVFLHDPTILDEIFDFEVRIGASGKLVERLLDQVESSSSSSEQPQTDSSDDQAIQVIYGVSQAIVHRNPTNSDSSRVLSDDSGLPIPRRRKQLSDDSDLPTTSRSQQLSDDRNLSIPERRQEFSDDTDLPTLEKRQELSDDNDLPIPKKKQELSDDSDLRNSSSERFVEYEVESSILKSASPAYESSGTIPIKSKCPHNFDSDSIHTSESDPVDSVCPIYTDNSNRDSSLQAIQSTDSESESIRPAGISHESGLISPVIVSITGNSEFDRNRQSRALSNRIRSTVPATDSSESDANLPTCSQIIDSNKSYVVKPITTAIRFSSDSTDSDPIGAPHTRKIDSDRSDPIRQADSQNFSTHESRPTTRKSIPDNCLNGSTVSDFTISDLSSFASSANTSDYYSARNSLPSTYRSVLRKIEEDGSTSGLTEREKDRYLNIHGELVLISDSSKADSESSSVNSPLSSPVKRSNKTEQFEEVIEKKKALTLTVVTSDSSKAESEASCSTPPREDSSSVSSTPFTSPIKPVSKKTEQFAVELQQKIEVLAEKRETAEFSENNSNDSKPQQDEIEVLTESAESCQSKSGDSKQQQQEIEVLAEKTETAESSQDKSDYSEEHFSEESQQKIEVLAEKSETAGSSQDKFDDSKQFSKELQKKIEALTEKRESSKCSQDKSEYSKEKQFLEELQKEIEVLAERNESAEYSHDKFNENAKHSDKEEFIQPKSPVTVGSCSSMSEGFSSSSGNISPKKASEMIENQTETFTKQSDFTNGDHKQDNKITSSTENRDKIAMELVEQISALTTESDKYLVQISDLKKEIKICKSEVAASVQTCSALESEVAAYKQKCAALEAELSATAQKSAALEAELRASSQKYAALQTELANSKVNESGDARMKSEIESLRTKESKLLEEIESLKAIIINLEGQLKVAQKSEAKLSDDLSSKTQSELHINRVMEEYEKSIASLIAENSNMKNERDTAQLHLANIELAFSDVHKKYERCKAVVEGFKNNEESFKQNIALNEDTIVKQEQKYEALKTHAMAQIDKSNQELATMKKAHEQELSKLTAQMKRLEIKNNSLMEAYQQKSKECEQLSAVCDEYLGSC